LARVALLLVALATALPIQPSTVAAQEPGQRRNLLDMFFGNGPRYERYPRYEPRYDRSERYDRDNGSIIDMTPRPPRNRGTVRAAVPPREPQVPAPPKPEPVTKLEDARKILVVGDFLAGGVGSELETAFETSPGVAVVARSDGSSGLVRDDHFDWLTSLPEMIDEVKPAVVVVMLGANDRQQMTVGDGREKFRSDGWFNEYENRIVKLAGIVTSRKLPLLWVGLPAFQSPSLTADAVTLNALYRSQVEKAGGEFVDIWDGFVDEDGKFILTGSDINGQQVRLRGSDGITFTKAGKRKLAFYVERFARRHLGDMASPELVDFGAGSLPALTALPSPANPAAPTQPISLLDPELDGGSELLGASPPPASLVESPRDKLVRRGELPTAPAGRVDDYRIEKTQ
jgi:hypothetical protein